MTHEMPLWKIPLLRQTATSAPGGGCNAGRSVMRDVGSKTTCGGTFPGGLCRPMGDRAVTRGDRAGPRTSAAVSTSRSTPTRWTPPECPRHSQARPSSRSLKNLRRTPVGWTQGGRREVLAYCGPPAPVRCRGKIHPLNSPTLGSPQSGHKHRRLAFRGRAGRITQRQRGWISWALSQ